MYPSDWGTLLRHEACSRLAARFRLHLMDGTTRLAAHVALHTLIAGVGYFCNEQSAIIEANQ